jgi:tetratricopeptide (TPR) repeat protein
MKRQHVRGPVRCAAHVTLAVLGAIFVIACASHARPPREPAVTALRTEGAKLTDPEQAGTWLLREMLSPGGDAASALRARGRLDALGTGGMYAALGRGLDDALHGRLAAAAEHYLEAVRAARDSGDARAPLIAWFAANRGVSLSRDAPDLWKSWKPFVERAITDPRAIGWRARGELVEWSIDQAWTEGATDMDRRAVELYGCLSNARIAGPFGRGAAIDATRSFPPEDAGPWPYRWDPDPGVSRAPRVLAVEAHSCAIQSQEKIGEGIFYAEAYFDLADAREVLVAVQGALAVRVDDALVLSRDIRDWGVWPRFGVSVHLSGGRHRIVARIGEPSTSIRVMRPDGTPLGVTGSKDGSASYAMDPPRVVRFANVLDHFISDGNVQDPGDDLTRALAGFLAHLESSDDVASVLVEPLIAKTDTAAGPALSLAAIFAESDPIFESSQASDLVRELHDRAAKKDKGLWVSRLALLLGVADKKGAEEAVLGIQRLAAEFPGVPEVQLALARLYGELGWAGEHARTIKELVAHFPNDPAALHAAVEVYDGMGDAKTADALVERIRSLDRDDDIVLTRALAREDYPAALLELERLAKLHPEQKDLAERIHDVKVRAGDLREVTKKLEAAVAKEPMNARARLDLADARYASGDEHALTSAVADGVQAGANPAALTNAIDLVEGVTELEPYRLDARAIIDDYEKKGRVVDGTAARVLDYSALWVRADGSSRMLEHEIVRIQSAEAISTFAEHRGLEGTVLHMRVIKKDGTTLEPEIISGKETVTFPHLEVGDYIETEQVLSTAGDGRGGVEYMGPRWFFREENVGYARSEFLVISPESRELVVETTGAVPPPQIEKHDGFVTRRWRVDESPAAPTEPGSAPITEFLPSVRIGWGVTRERRLTALADALTQVTPVDPRIRRIATEVVGPVPASDLVGRAKRLYRWLLDNVEPGDEADGRRVIIGKRGNLWHGFRMLCRAANVPVRYAVAQSRLAAPPLGPLSASTLFTQPVAKIESKVGKDAAWLTLGNKYAPFGYLPVEVRGMPAYFVDGDAREKTTVPEQGRADSLGFSGKGELDAAGTLSLDLVEEFSGKLAIGLRRGLSQVAEHELHDVLETNLLAQTLHGGSLVRYSIEHRDDLDAPLVIRMTVKVSRFAQKSDKTLVFTPPLSPNLGRLATLPSRQTPLLIGETLHRSISVDIALPPGASLEGLMPGTVEDAGHRVVIKDSVKPGVLHVERTVDIPAGRIQPADYPRFSRFARQADDALSRAVQLRLP